MTERSAWIGAVRLVLLAGVVWLQSGAGIAQQPTLPGLGDPSAPLEIEADNGLELYQDRQLVVAKGNVVAKQGEVVLRSDLLSASYEDSETGQRRIRRLDAVGNVRIETAKERLFGDYVTYDLVRELMVITGDDMRIEAPSQTIRARDSLEFWGAEQRAVARGDAVVTQDTTSMRADVIEAILRRDPQKPVKPAAGLAQTASEIVEGDRGDYDVPNQIATLTGNVQISRGKNQLNGEQAVVNLKSGVSRLTGGKTGRVRSILFPGGGNNLDAPPPQQSRPKPSAVDVPLPVARPRGAR